MAYTTYEKRCDNTNELVSRQRMGLTMRLGKLVMIVFLIVGQGSYAAERPYYTWVDENGVVNYSQQKPRGIEAKLVSKEHRFGVKVLEEPKRDSVATSPPVVNAENEARAAEEKRAEEEFERTMQEIADTKQVICEQAQRNLEWYTNRGRIRLKGEDGEYRILPDEIKQENIQKFRNKIDENC